MDDNLLTRVAMMKKIAELEARIEAAKRLILDHRRLAWGWNPESQQRGAWWRPAAEDEYQWVSDLDGAIAAEAAAKEDRP